MKLFTIEEPIRKGKTYQYAVFSDLHIGSKEFDGASLKRDLEKCKDNDAKVIINGDTMDLILLQDLKRASASRIKPEEGQINQFIEEATEALIPYVAQLCIIGMGNHETSMIKHHGVDVLAWLIERLNREKKNGKIQEGHYQNFVRINFLDPKRGYKLGAKYTIFMSHGIGGSAPVSKGMIDFNRIVVANDADLYLMGHKHNHLVSTMPSATVSEDDKITVRNRIAVQTPSYTYQINAEKDNAWIDSFYGKQAAPGFARIELEPVPSTRKIYLPYEIKPKIWIDSNDSNSEMVFDGKNIIKAVEIQKLKDKKIIDSLQHVK